VEITRHILNSDIYIRQLVTLALFRKGEQKTEDEFKKRIFLVKKEFEEKKEDYEKSKSSSNSSSERDS